VEKFFREYLPTLRGMSLHTIRSYRDALILFLRFVSSHSDQRLEDLCLDAFTAEHVTQFLMSLEVERHNSIATRNARLAALHTFARFLAAESPEHLAKWQRVLGLPFKRGARNAPIDYLESTEAETLLGQIDRSTETGRRDYALFALMLNTGARVQEMLDLKLSDVRTEPPCQVRLRGKGGKVRLCPIWASTAARLRELAEQVSRSATIDTLLFTNRRGGKLTRFGVRYLLNKYIVASAATASTLHEAYPPALAATYHGDLPAQGGRRFRDDQPMAWACDAEHDDEVRARRSGPEAPGACPSVSGSVGSARRRRRSGRRQRRRMAKAVVTKLCGVAKSVARVTSGAGRGTPHY